jgi:predicted phage baseplate assembly protein
MAFTPKNVDDRAFEDLVAEARRRIPAYTPEWTDHNESDPGIALVELFAWLAETSIFRLNQVPDERMYVSFLDLIGFGPAPAVPARGIVEVKVTPGSGAHDVSPYQLRLTAPGETADVPFEADAEVSLIGASIGAALVDDGTSLQRTDRTAANTAGAPAFPPFGPTNIAGRALYLGLDATPPVGPPLLLPPGATAVMQLYVAVEEKPAEIVPATTSTGTTPTNLEADVTWQGKTGVSTWTALEVVDDQTRGFTQSGFIEVKLTGALIASQEPGDPDAKDRFWIRAVASDTTKPETRSIRYVIPNAVSVRQWQTFAEELLLPGSDGTANQTRRVLNAPILLDPENPVVVEVNEQQASGDLAWTPWTQVDDLATRVAGGVAATPGQPLSIFVVSGDAGGVEFGDGIEGRIPPRGANNLRITYRSGGGAAGNVNAQQLSLAASIPGVDGVDQREPTTGGADAEDPLKARDDAPHRIRALERAVTPADFEILARTSAGVARASALNRYNPRVPGSPVSGAITLVVVPPRIGADVAPAPSQPFLDGVAQLLEPYRVLTAELFVLGPRYRKVKIGVEIDVKSANDAAGARSGVVDALNTFFDPIDGGPDHSGWPLGGTIAFGEVMSTVLAVPKVAAVRSLSMWLDGALQPACADVPLGSQIDLVASDGHTVKVRAPEIRR